METGTLHEPEEEKAGTGNCNVKIWEKEFQTPYSSLKNHKILIISPGLIQLC